MTASEAREAAAWHRAEACRNRNDGFGKRMRMHDRAAVALDAFADGIDAEARGRAHGLLAAAMLAEASHTEATALFCGETTQHGSSYWEGVMDEDESLLGDLAVLAKDATDGR